MNLDELISKQKGKERIIYGNSIFIEFIKNHSFLDCITEAIQNDFDAKSPEILFQFDPEMLTIQGKGEPVDNCGWERLDLFLGVTSNSQRKIGSIGSKNQGVRSYFLFGDVMGISSAGRAKKFNVLTGTPQGEIEDNSTLLKKGIEIQIKLRTAETEGLPSILS